MAALLSIGSTVTGTGFSGIIQTLSLSGVSCPAIDISGIADSVATYVLGRQIGGTLEVSVICSARPALPTANQSSPTSFTVNFGASGAAYTFNGYIQKVQIDGGIDAPIKANFTILVAGVISQPV